MMKRLVTVAVTTALMPFAAAAQSNDDEGSGIRMGSFIARPSATATIGYNSNIFRDENDKTDSLIARAAVRGQIESDWNRHGLRFDTGLVFGYLENSTDDNYLDGYGELSGVLDVKRNIRVIASAGFSREHDARGTDDADSGSEAEPIEYDDWSFTLRGETSFGRFRVDPFVEIDYLNFHDTDQIGGGTLNKDDRDRVEGETGVEFGYGVRRGYEAFIRTSYLWTDYDDRFDDSLVERSSDGFRILGGVKVDLTRLITASAGVGYLDVDYDDATLEDFSGFSMDADVEWSITRRTTLFATASRDTNATTIDGASDYVDTEGSIGVTHELLQNLSVSGSASYAYRDFTGISRDDDLFTGRIGAEWMVNRRVYITPEYRFGARNSNDTDDYNVHEAMVSATLRF